ncbi:hypothetical protein MLD38_035096 [Melastoma candidum]|uniref:Uncharacterized protein n=1 Tax=Melastoma candidum TaxID=119954 RepID=A0ACB9MBQ2_9MYRT|nr:hypothetical protein MLD38_035096 [Melastoma candidum]
MHGRRNRHPGNGYEAVRSRSSQEGPTRGGPGFYNSECGRGFDKSFSRNQRQNHRRDFHRPPPHTPPGPARDDIFVEVGRLAAEYLVSQGVLPPGALPAKWQNGSLKKPITEIRDFRPHEEENMQFPGDVRTSVLDQLGNTSLGEEAGRRKYDDDYGTAGPKKHVRGKRKRGSSRNCGLDWGREYGGTGSSSDRHRDRTSPRSDLEWEGSSRRREEHPVGRDYGERRTVDYDPSPGFHEEEQFVKDGDRTDVDQETRCKLREEQVLCIGDNDLSELTGTCATPPEGMDGKDSEPEIKGQQIEELSEMKENVVKDTSEATDGDSLDPGSSLRMTNNISVTSGEVDDVDPRNGEDISGEIIDPGKDKTVKEIIVSGNPTCENFTMHASVSDNRGTDLKALCKLENFPTRMLSSLAKSPKRRSVFNDEGIDHIRPTESMVNDEVLGVSTNDGTSGGCDEPKVLNSEIPMDLMSRVVDEEKGLHFEDAIGPAQELESGFSLGDGIPGSASLLDQASSSGPESSKNGMLENDQIFNERLHGSGSEDPAVKKLGEKQQHGGIDMDGQHARREECPYQSRKDWLSPDSINAGESSNLVNPVSSRVGIIGDSLSSRENETRVVRGSDDNIKLPEVTPEQNFMDTEVKQFFPSLFKICDLNLMESSNGHENQVQDDTFTYPSGASLKKSDSPIDINLYICNPVTTAEDGECMAGGMEVEKVDLEDEASSITGRR